MDERSEALAASLEKISAGDTQGIDEIYVAIGDRMLAVALGIAKNRAVAEEIVQDSFLKLAKYADRFRRRDNAYAWILKIVKNTALNTIRYESRRAGGGDVEVLPIADEREDPGRRDDCLLAKSLLERLDPRERAVLVDKYWLDLTVRDIAARRGMSKSAVARLIASAEARLHRFLVD